MQGKDLYIRYDVRELSGPKAVLMVKTNSHLKTTEGGRDPVIVLASDGIAAECFSLRKQRKYLLPFLTQ